MPETKSHVVFVHGLWLHSSSRQPWAEPLRLIPFVTIFGLHENQATFSNLRW